MQITNREHADVLTINKIIDFTPWPFADPEVKMTKCVSYIDSDGEVWTSDCHENGWNLTADSDNRLAILSDGTLAILHPDIGIIADLADRRES